MVQAQPRTGPTMTWPSLPDDFKLLDEPVENSPTLHWLRWWDADGNLLLWSSEQVEAER